MFLNNMNINILRKASPHLDERSRMPITVLLKLSELNECINNMSHAHNNGLISCDNSVPAINTESLLKDIRPECSKSGKDLIDLFLNISKTKDFYNTYKVINNLSNNVNNTTTFKNNLSEEQLNRINELSKIIHQEES